MVDRIVYFGLGVALGMGSFLAHMGSLIGWDEAHLKDCRFLSGLCFSSSQIVFQQMMEAPSSWVRSCEGGWIPKTHHSWDENRFRLSQIPKETEDQAAFLSFLEKRWLAKANGFFSSEVNLMAPCFGVHVQVSPSTRNSYARDPFTHFSKVYENRMSAWKKVLPHPSSYPLILTRPCNFFEYIEIDPERRVVDVTELFPSRSLDPSEWLELWEMHRMALRKQCKENNIPLERLLCIQRVEQNGIGGVRILPLDDAICLKKEDAALLAWVSTGGFTASLVELDRLPEDLNFRKIGSRVLPNLKIDAFAESIRRWGEINHIEREDVSVMIEGMLSILYSLPDFMGEILCPTRRLAAQMSMENILECLAKLKKSQETCSFFEIAALVEQIYLHVLPLLEIFSPFDFEDFSRIYADVLSFPESLRPLSSYSLFASGMTGLSGIFKAAKKTVGKAPRVIYGMNSYFECIHLAKQATLACSEEEATDLDWEEADLLLMQFNPVLRRDNPEHLEYQVERVCENIRRSLGKQKTKRLTVALDATIDFLDSSRIKDLLEEFQEEIQEGILNVVCYRSGLKFDLFGMDNYSGAPYFAIHAKNPYWSHFDALLEDPALRTDPLSLQWFCLSFQNAYLELDLYRKQIFQNTRELLGRVPKELFDAKRRYRIVPVAEDVDPSFIDIKVSGPFHKIRASAIVGGCLYLRSMQEGFPIFYRRSFGFYHPNFGVLFAEDCSTIRLTLGLDPAQIDTYVRCIQEIHQLN